jgi:hypothetical protein
VMTRGGCTDEPLLRCAGVGINISNRSPTICLQDILSTEEHPCTVTKYVFEPSVMFAVVCCFGL